MIKFFRKIRYELIGNAPAGSAGRYFTYAIGEIILVVIGILIALSINNWNSKLKNQKIEKEFLSNLWQDLRSDSLGLVKLVDIYSKAHESKLAFIKYNNSKSSPDSLVVLFNNQYSFVTKDFVPITTTIDEIKGSGSLNLITNNELKRKIIRQYNLYDELNEKLQIGHEKLTRLQDFAYKHIHNIMEPTVEEIIYLNEIPYFRNHQVANFTGTLKTVSTEALHNCTETMKLIKEELQHD